MYGDVITKSMERTIKETNRRRKIQMEYNEKHGIVPKTIIKDIREVIQISDIAEEREEYDNLNEALKSYNNDIDKLIEQYEKEMREAAQNLQFEKAAHLRDVIYKLKKDKETEF